MFDLATILSPACTAIGVDVHSRKRALEWISERMSQAYPTLDAREVFLAMQGRERLGSTGLGEGVAIPHCRNQHDRIVGAFVRLASGIDYDAPDDQPVDMLFALVVPESETNDHLKVLAALSRAFGDEQTVSRLRSAATPEALRSILLERAAQAVS